MSSFSSSGNSVVDVVRLIASGNPQISQFEVFEPHAVVSHRLENELAIEQDILDQALGLRERTYLPFWDAVILSSFGKGESAHAALNRAVFHNAPPRRTFQISVDRWSSRELQNLSNDTSDGSFLVLRSRVLLRDGTHAHIPMLDYHCFTSPENLSLAAYAANLIDKGGGVILQSGKSYHYYGLTLMPDHEYIRFMGRALLLCPLIDRAWIAHQLIERTAGLRVTEAKGHPSIEPQVVARVPSS